MSVKVRISEQNVPTVWRWCTKNLKQGTWRLWTGFVSTSYYTVEFDNERDLTLIKLIFNDVCE